jgi:hypothetical protein
MPRYIQLFFTAVAVVTLLTVVIALTRPNPVLYLAPLLMYILGALFRTISGRTPGK